MTVAFGPWSTGLGLGVAFAWLIAARLAFTAHNRAANRWLAALVFLVALRVVVYAIGYAGFYDAWPWLSFAPLDLPLFFGPLLWFHVVARTGAALPRGWAWHLVPGALHLAYCLAIFVQPLAFKDAWAVRVQEPFVEPFEQLATYASLAAYLWVSAARARDYDRWLAAHVSDREEHRLPWLWIALAGMALVLGVQVAFEFTSRFVVPLDYFDRFPEYVAYALLVVLLGLEAWRYAEHRFPPVTPDATTDVESAGEHATACPPGPFDAAGAPAVPAAPRLLDAPRLPEAALPVAAAPAARPERDWSERAREWTSRIESAGWWREPQLTLSDVARRLGTNENYLSRALNEGLGQGFNEFVNRLRVKGVQAALDAGAEGDLLALALDAGFGSKASFNRAFRAYVGTTPADYRAQAIAAASVGSRPSATSSTVSRTT